MLSLSVITGCSSDSDEPTEETPSKPAKAASPRDDEKLGKRVEQALDLELIDDSDPLFVESGLERVSDGIHTHPKLPPGVSYELAVVCSGKGEVRLSVRAERRTSRSVSCDGVPTVQRTVGLRSRLEIDTTGLRGASGMVGWRVRKIEE